VPNKAFNIIGFQQTRNATGELPHDARATLLHGGNIHADVASRNAVLLEFVLRAVKQFRGFEQCFRWDATRIQARPTKRILTVLVRPLIDASNTHPMLRRPDRGDVASRTCTNYHYIELPAHLGLLLHRFGIKSAITADSDLREVV
jgi:hypothetical protein